MTDILVLILFVFGRVFMGLNIATLRLGEILIGVSALFFVYFLIKDLINFKNLLPIFCKFVNEFK